MRDRMMADIGSRIDAVLLADAAALGIDIVAACEAGLQAAIRVVRDADLLRENAAAIAEWNGWADESGPVSDDPYRA